jgi:hypothetical protein
MAFPTWLMTTLLLPFVPEHHPWHGRYFTLEEWYHGETDACREMDFLGWLLAVQGLMLLYLTSQVR